MIKDIIFRTVMLKGEAGSTIVSMEKTGHSGSTDIYTITFDDGSTTEIRMENMSSIESIEKTGQTGTEDTYTVTLADGSTQSFSVLNHNDDYQTMSEELTAGLEAIDINLSRSTMTRILTEDTTNLTTGSYVKVPFPANNGINNSGIGLTATDDGGIKIGAGINKVLISGSIAFVLYQTASDDNPNPANSSIDANRLTRIVKNSADVGVLRANTLAWEYGFGTTGSTGDRQMTFAMAPALVDVQENDVIYLTYYTQDASDVIGGHPYGARTSLTVEVVGQALVDGNEVLY